MTTTDKLIAEVRRLDAAATKGPWGIPVANMHRVVAENPCIVIVDMPEESAFYGRENASYWRFGPEDGGRRSTADKRLISGYRTAAPALADAVEARDSMIHRLADAMWDCGHEPERFGLELVDGKWRIRET